MGNIWEWPGNTSYGLTFFLQLHAPYADVMIMTLGFMFFLNALTLLYMALE
jgi:hypothetical protein